MATDEPTPATSESTGGARPTRPGPTDASRPALPPALVELETRDKGTTADAILVAAGELFATRGPSQVSLREVAERAGVNYGLIHHYFGTKEGLLIELMRLYTTYGRTFVNPDASESTAQLFDAESGRFAEIFTSMVLDGADPRKVFGETATMEAYTESVEALWRRQGDPAEAPFEAKVVAGFVMFNILVWDLYAPYIRVLASLEDRELPELRDEVLALLQHLLTAFGPGQPPTGAPPADAGD